MKRMRKKSVRKKSLRKRSVKLSRKSLTRKNVRNRKLRSKKSLKRSRRKINDGATEHEIGIEAGKLNYFRDFINWSYDVNTVSKINYLNDIIKNYDQYSKSGLIKEIHEFLLKIDSKPTVEIYLLKKILENYNEFKTKINKIKYKYSDSWFCSHHCRSCGKCVTDIIEFNFNNNKIKICNDCNIIYSSIPEYINAINFVISYASFLQKETPEEKTFKVLYEPLDLPNELKNKKFVLIVDNLNFS